MSKMLRKAKHVYKNQGVKGIAQKTKSTLRYRAGLLRPSLLVPGQSAEHKKLREEYGFLSNEIFQITSQDLEASKKCTQVAKPKDIKTATWFIPYFNHFGFNGIQTIFRFVEKLSVEGVHNTIVIYDNPGFDVASFESQMKEHFPNINNYEIVIFGENKLDDIEKLAPSDIAFCTFWVSAYLLLKFNKTKRKYYFIQDYEPQFYEAGSTSALTESTYRFGFKGVVNTPGLLAAVNQRNGLEGISFVPTVNRELYHPDPNRPTNKKVRIFMYARPFNPRNSFSLGILTIQHLLEKYGSSIEIVTAGAPWNEAEYGLKGKVTNLGLIKSLQGVADLYRTCDIGFSYMLTPHTSYQMLEYTASGMATVMNFNEDHTWLHRDGENCLLSEPSPLAMAEKIGMLIDDPALRKKLVKNAQKELAYTWDQQMDMLWNDILNSKD